MGTMKDHTYTRRPSDIFPKGVFELTVSYKRKLEKRITVTTSFEIADIARGFYAEGSIEYQETFLILLLDRTNHIYAYKIISTGSLAGTVVDPKMIFQTALLSHASSVVLCHNHPSGNVERASQQDIDLTRKIVSGGKLLEIQILDHIILAVDKHFSFADEGMM
ncbi:JAB domain-containing protein [soil metagenome]